MNKVLLALTLLGFGASQSSWGQLNFPGPYIQCETLVKANKEYDHVRIVIGQTRDTWNGITIEIMNVFDSITRSVVRLIEAEVTTTKSKQSLYRASKRWEPFDSIEITIDWSSQDRHGYAPGTFVYKGPSKLNTASRELYCKEYK